MNNDTLKKYDELQYQISLLKLELEILNSRLDRYEQLLNKPQ